MIDDEPRIFSRRRQPVVNAACPWCQPRGTEPPVKAHVVALTAREVESDRSAQSRNDMMTCW